MSPMSPRLRILLNYDYFAKLEFAYIRQDVRTTIIIIQTDRQTERLCAAKSLSLGLAQACPNKMTGMKEVPQRDETSTM